MLAVQQNLERIESEKQFKEEALQALKKEVSEVTQQRTEIQRIINSLISEFEPMQVILAFTAVKSSRFVTENFFCRIL